MATSSVTEGAAVLRRNAALCHHLRINCGMVSATPTMAIREARSRSCEAPQCGQKFTASVMQAAMRSNKPWRKIKGNRLRHIETGLQRLGSGDRTKGDFSFHAFLLAPSRAPTHWLSGDWSET